MMNRSRANILALLIPAAALAFCSTCTLATEGPRLVKGDAPECREALSMAQAVYRSDTPYLYGALVIPSAVKSRLVLGARGQDPSHTDPLEVDDKVFDTQPDPSRDIRNIYVQRVGQGGYRLAVQEVDMGWRGDIYNVFALPDNMSLAEATASMNGPEQKIDMLARYQWLLPLVFQRDNSPRLWFLLLGQPLEVFAAWEAYDVADEAMRPLCRIEFLPKSDQIPSALLPPAVREFERLVDQTMGSGANEGTMQATAHLRGEVRYTWANVALRPWALRRPYNLRETVDAGLAAWAKADPGNRRTLQAIHRQYPLAEAALAGYYRQHFGRTLVDARKSAAYAIDLAFRMHFVFHEEGRWDDDHPTGPPNPWTVGPVTR